MKLAILISAALLSAALGQDCAADGERNVGAPDFPAVTYKPCCNGQASAAKAGDWGLFCGASSSSAADCYGPGERNQGAAGEYSTLHLHSVCGAV